MVNEQTEEKEVFAVISQNSGQIDQVTDEELRQMGMGTGLGDGKEDTETRYETMKKALEKDVHSEGRDEYWMDVDRMVNEGLGGGLISNHSGRIDSSIGPIEEDPPHELNNN